MADENDPSTAQHRLSFRRVEELQWETYAVHCQRTRIGFVTRLPEGVWLAYLPTGISSSDWSSRDEAAEALHTAVATTGAAHAATPVGAASSGSPSSRPTAIARHGGRTC